MRGGEVRRDPCERLASALTVLEFGVAHTGTRPVCGRGYTVNAVDGPIVIRQIPSKREMLRAAEPRNPLDSAAAYIDRFLMCFVWTGSGQAGGCGAAASGATALTSEGHTWWR